MSLPMRGSGGFEEALAEGLGVWNGSWCEVRTRATVAPCAGGEFSNYKIILIIYKVLKRY